MGELEPNGSVQALSDFVDCRQDYVMDWLELHPKATWNDFDPSELERFEGRVVRASRPGKFTFVQRFNPYRLKMKNRTLEIYGDAPWLREHVGERVLLEGKRVQMAVEGRVFNEIWPTRACSLDSAGGSHSSN